jgi:hypothetical protein
MATSRNIKGKWLRFLTLFIVLYFALWELTHLVGMPTVCRTVKASLPVDSSYAYTDVSRRMKSKTNGPIYYCQATAYAPFLVRADYGWQSGSLSGDGGSALYFWFFGFTSRIREIEHWAS